MSATPTGVKGSRRSVGSLAGTLSRLPPGSILAFGVTVLGIVLTVLLFLMARSRDKGQLRADFQGIAGNLATAFERTWDGHMATLDGLAAFFAASDEVREDEFRQFVEFALARKNSYVALEWVPRVSEAERAEFETRLRAVRGSAFSIRQVAEGGALERAEGRSDYYPVVYVEPLSGNEAALGFDLGSESTRRSAIERARDSGTKTCSGLIRLVQDESSESALLVVTPVYFKGVRPATVTERRVRFEGAVVGVLRLEDLLEGAFGGLNRHGVQLQLKDATGMASEELLAASPDGAVERAGSGDTTSKVFDAGGRTWILTFQAGRSFHQGQGWLHWFLLLLGFPATLLLAGRILATARHSRQIQESNGQLRRALVSEEQVAQENGLLDSIIHRINEGRDLTDILNYLFETFHLTIPFDRIGLALLQDDGRCVQSIWAKSRVALLRLPPDYRLSVRDTSLQRVLDSGQPRVLNDLEAYLRARPESRSTQLLVEEGMRSSLTCPLVANGKPIGFLFFSCCGVEAYNEDHVRRFGRIARHFSVTVERALYMEQLAAKNAALEEEVARRRMAERSLSLAYERQKKPFQVGGTLHPDALSYVERDADRKLLETLLGGELCYVLTSRQMGKSSLMVRAARRLQQLQVAVVMVDLTAIGQPLTSEQWFQGLISQIGWQLKMEEELEAYWRERRSLPPAQRLFRALRDVVLSRTRGALVIFVDEIDSVRSLRFSADEFFAALRECHNRRTDDEELGRLGFCLLGSAAPWELVVDPQITPFNVGRPIRLQDFTPAEAWPLAQGLGRSPEVADELMGRILYWTNGHPYLTQRMCAEVLADPTVQSASAVDDLCDRVFLTGRPQEEDSNLVYVREGIRRSPASHELLRLYGRILQGDSQVADWRDETVAALELCGVTAVGDKGLKVRNRIYEHVFDQVWVDRGLLPLR